MTPPITLHIAVVTMIAVLTQSAYGQDCSAWCADKASGIYSNPCDTTCRSFIMCSNGATTTRTCGSGTLFNPALKVCDWPSQVQCSGVQPSSSPSPSAKPPPSPSGKPPPSPSPKPTPSPSPKPSPSPFPKPSPRPPPPKPSPSLSPKPPPSASPSPSPACTPTNFCQGKSDGLYANPCDPTCASFFNCANGATNQQSCPPSLVFNPTYKVCDHASNYKCTNPSPSPTSSPSPKPSPSGSPSPSPSPSPRPSPSPSPSPSRSPSPSPSPGASPSPSPTGGRKVIGYLENWRWYSQGSIPPSLTPYVSKLTHINYAFVTISYSQQYDSYYLDFTDPWADVGACLTGSCPATCVTLTATCPGQVVGLVPTTKTQSATCPAGCYNRGGSAEYPRRCNAVVSDLNTPLKACGHVAYVQQFIANTAPNVRVLTSVGGWYDSNYFTMATEPKYRAGFVNSILDFLDTFRFDGVDFDWEYPGWEHGGQPPFGQSAPGSPDATTDCSFGACSYSGRRNDGANFVATLQLLRTKMASRRSWRGEPYLVTMAGPSGSDKLNKMDLGAVCAQMDWVNIMTYDMHGAWDSTTGHQSAIFDPSGDPLTVSNVVKEYVAGGCPRSKLVVGVPFYGRSFKGVQTGSNPALPGYRQPFSASQTAAQPYTAAMPMQKNIAGLGYRTIYDTARNASYAWDAASQTFITYDNEAAVAAKADYIRREGLAGAMIWALGMETPSLWTALTSGL